MSEFERSQRATLTGKKSGLASTLPLIAVLGAATFLLFMLLASREVAVDPLPLFERVYVANDTTLLGLNPLSSQILYQQDGSVRLVVSPDQALLYTFDLARLEARNAATGILLWQKDIRSDGFFLPHPNGQFFYMLNPLSTGWFAVEYSTLTGDATGMETLLDFTGFVLAAVLSPDGSRIYMQTPDSLQLYDLTDGMLLLTINNSSLSADSDPRLFFDHTGNLLVVSHDQLGFVLLQRFDPFSGVFETHYRLSQSGLDSGLVRLAPNKQALLFPHAQSNGGVDGFVQLDLATKLETSFTTPDRILDLAWSYDSATIYALIQQTNGSALLRYASEDVTIMPLDDTMTSLAVGAGTTHVIELPPSKPIIRPLPTPAPLQPGPPNLPEFNFAQPYTQPFTPTQPLTINTQAEPHTIAWLLASSQFQPGNEWFELASDGSTQSFGLIDTYVLSDPPIFIWNTEADRSLVALDRNQEPFETYGHLRSCIANRIAQLMACMDNQSALITINLVSGESQSWHINATQSQAVIAISDQATVFFETTDSEKTIWQANMSQQQLIQTPLVTLAKASAVVVQADRIIYTDESELAYFDLVTSHTTVVAHIDIKTGWHGFWQVAPDGQSIAYALPAQTEGLFDMYIYEIDHAIYRLMYADLPYSVSSLRWTNDSAALLFRTREPNDIAYPERLWVLNHQQDNQWNGFVSYALPDGAVDIVAPSPDEILAVMYQGVKRSIMLFTPNATVQTFSLNHDGQWINFVGVPAN